MVPRTLRSVPTQSGPLARLDPKTFFVRSAPRHPPGNGVGGATYWTDAGGTFFDNAFGEAYFRTPLFESGSPYAVGSVGYQFDSDEWVETLGAGVDFRAFKKISAFSDIQWRFAEHTKDGVFLRLGVRFSF